MRAIRQICLALLAVFLPSGFVSAAEIYSASLSLDPAYDAGGCALVSSNGYGGTDRQLFIAPTDAYYSIKDYSSNNTQPLITVEAFDPTTRLLNQALGNQIYLASGTRVLLWAVYTGGYGTFAGCTGDGATENVTMRIVGENFSVPNPPTDITAVGIDGGATISFTAGSDNGVGISNYQYGTFDGSSWVYVALAPADFASPITVTGFANGEPVTMRLRAVNANGASAESETFSFTPSGPPDSPTGITPQSRDGGVEISFTPGSSNGSPITNYEYGILEGGVWNYVALDPPDALSPVVVSGLSAGADLTMRLRAVNANGAGAESVSFTVTPLNCASGAGGAADFIERLYVNLLGGCSDSDGLSYWLAVINAQSAARVALGFLFSDEFQSAGLSNELFVDTLYATLFDRQGDTVGRDHWVDELDGSRLREMVIYGFLKSQEFTALAVSYAVDDFNSDDEAAYQVRAFVERGYISSLGRQPDTVGFEQWVTGLTNQTYSGADVARAFFLGPEYAAKNTSDSQFISACYQTFFGREADAAGLQGWLDHLSLGNTRSSVIDGFSQSAEFAAFAAQYGITP